MRRFFTVRYKCKSEYAAQNEVLVRDLMAELTQTRTEGVRYAVFKLEDGVSFIHLVVTETEAMLEPLGRLDAYRALQHRKMDRFDERPVVTELHELGAYGLFPEALAPQKP